MLEKKLHFSTLKNIDFNKQNIKTFADEKFKTNILAKNNITKKGGLRYRNKFKKSLPEKPLISIVTVVLNNKNTIEDTIKSVLKQNYDNIEYIVIDGNSTDGTLDIIQKYEDGIDIWISEKDSGIFNAMNKGIVLCTGNFIGILNSDDQYTENALSIISNYINKNKNINYIFGSVIKDRLLSGFKKNKIKWKFNIFPAHSSGFFIKMEAQKKIGLYNENFKNHSDYDLIYRMIVKHKLEGIETKRDEVIGKFNTQGKTSKLSYIGDIHEEFKIRLNNNQNIIYLITLFFIKFFYYYICKINFIKSFFKILKSKFKLKY